MCLVWSQSTCGCAVESKCQRAIGLSMLPNLENKISVFSYGGMRSADLVFFCLLGNSGGNTSHLSSPAHSPLLHFAK